jgi:hypothetical protein
MLIFNYIYLFDIELDNILQFYLKLKNYTIYNKKLLPKIE